MVRFNRSFHFETLNQVLLHSLSTCGTQTRRRLGLEQSPNEALSVAVKVLWKLELCVHDTGVDLHSIVAKEVEYETSISYVKIPRVHQSTPLPCERDEMISGAR